MAAKNNKAVWNLAIIAGIGFVLWKLWPTIKKGLGGGSSSGGGGVAGASPQYPYPNQDNSQKPSSLPPLSFGSGGGSGSGSGGGGGLAAFVNSVQNQGWANALGISTSDPALTDLNNQGLNSSEYGPGFDNLTLQNLNNLPSYSYNDPNAPWNNDTSGTDVQSYDLGGVALDNSGGGSYDNSGSGTLDQVDYTSYDSSGDY